MCRNDMAHIIWEYNSNVTYMPIRKKLMQVFRKWYVIFLFEGCLYPLNDLSYVKSFVFFVCGTDVSLFLSTCLISLRTPWNVFAFSIILRHQNSVGNVNGFHGNNDPLTLHCQYHGPLARYVRLWLAHAPGMPGTFSPPPRVSDPDKHHGTCMTHVPWCMPG